MVRNIYVVSIPGPGHGVVTSFAPLGRHDLSPYEGHGPTVAFMMQFFLLLPTNSVAVVINTSADRNNTGELGFAATCAGAGIAPKIALQRLLRTVV